MSDTTKRGYLVPRITEVMDWLSSRCPPCRYPADADKQEESLPAWVRGGTTPSGADFGDAQAAVSEATYFIGRKYIPLEYGAPQRIVWLPPPPGSERFVRSETTGPHLDDVGQGEGALAFRRWRTRVVPMLAHLWCNDYDDCDILVQWLATAIFATNAGGPESVGEAVTGGGYAEEEMSQRGVVYHLNCNFVFPVVRDPLVQHKVKEVTVDPHPVSVDVFVGRPV